MAASPAGSPGAPFLLPPLSPASSSGCPRAEGREERDDTNASHLGERAAEGSGDNRERLWSPAGSAD